MMIRKDTPEDKIRKLTPDCRCEMCDHGCKVGSGLLAEGDAKRIAEHLGITEEALKERFLEEVEMLNKRMLKPRTLKQGKPYGRCVFFDGRCKIHEVKPLQCRIAMGCKEYGHELTAWFMLNHVLNIDDPESIRQYATYLRSGGKTLPGGGIEEMIQDKELLKSILSYERLR